MGKDEVVTLEKELHFMHPVGKPINNSGGQYGASRPYGAHKGIDYLAPHGIEVRALE